MTGPCAQGHGGPLPRARSQAALSATLERARFAGREADAGLVSTRRAALTDDAGSGAKRARLTDGSAGAGAAAAAAAVARETIEISSDDGGSAFEGGDDDASSSGASSGGGGGGARRPAKRARR